VIWHRLSEQDLIEPCLHIRFDSPASAERLLDAVEPAVRLLLENPRAGRQVEFRSLRAKGVRSWVVQSFQAFLIFYRHAGHDLEIVRFIHGARDIPALLEDDR